MKAETSNDKKNMTIENDSVTEIQVSNLDTSTEIDNNDSLSRVVNMWQESNPLSIKIT